MAADAEAHGGAGSVWDRLGPALALVFVLAPLLLFRGGLIEEEAAGFLQKNWSERGALQEIFDVRGWDFYQGRELSYAIDWLDGQWVRLLLSQGVVCFAPPSQLLASLAFLWIGARLAPRALPRLAPALRWLVLLLPMSTYAFLSTMGLLYRATKPLVAPMLLALLLLVLAEHRKPRLGRGAAFGSVFALALCMGLLDRQGLFYVLALIGVLALAWLRTRRGLPILAGATAGAAAWYAYFRYLGPLLIHALEDYWPSMRFQRLRPERLLQPALWSESAGILGDWISALLGRLPWPLALAGLGLALAWWAWRLRGRPLLVALVLLLAPGALLCQLAMIVIMLDRHPPVSWLSHRLWYYPLPFHVLIAFGLLWALEHLRLQQRRLARTTLVAALAGLVLLNVCRWPEQLAAVAQEPFWGDMLRRSALLMRSLQQGHAEPLLDGDHRRFYFDCLEVSTTLAGRAAPQVGEGEGILRPRVVGGSVNAPARKEAHLLARTNRAGRYVLGGTLHVRPGESIEVLFDAPPRSLARLDGPQTGGRLAVRVPLELTGGTNRVLLLSRLPEERVAGESRTTTAGYEIQLPLLLWPVPPD